LLVAVFLGEVLWAAVLLDWVAAVDGFFDVAAGAAGLSGVSEEVAGVEDCCASARAAEDTLISDPHSTAAASTHHHLRPNRTTISFSVFYLR
jgi:hypothetical protein